ncbi:hypothetical protein [Teichococcus vastitatis]|uniref:Uncharacterized protein n=1 Tax=Teichococcus vastitatis TaxID=2307076 RepID=A0ABS9WBU1_9PROT|nr:hypothetical protein [Pseudoroseomonas vastitatis]MCI0756701.1 hypothetical protein [Pseudoroseomonas vastitatis]
MVVEELSIKLHIRQLERAIEEIRTKPPSLWYLDECVAAYAHLMSKATRKAVITDGKQRQAMRKAISKRFACVGTKDGKALVYQLLSDAARAAKSLDPVPDNNSWQALIVAYRAGMKVLIAFAALKQSHKDIFHWPNGRPNLAGNNTLTPHDLINCLPQVDHPREEREKAEAGGDWDAVVAGLEREIELAKEDLNKMVWKDVGFSMPSEEAA